MFRVFVIISSNIIVVNKCCPYGQQCRYFLHSTSQPNYVDLLNFCLVRHKSCQQSWPNCRGSVAVQILTATDRDRDRGLRGPRSTWRPRKLKLKLHIVHFEWSITFPCRSPEQGMCLIGRSWTKWKLYRCTPNFECVKSTNGNWLPMPKQNSPTKQCKCT